MAERKKVKKVDTRVKYKPTNKDKKQENSVKKAPVKSKKISNPFKSILKGKKKAPTQSITMAPETKAQKTKTVKASKMVKRSEPKAQKVEKPTRNFKVLKKKKPSSELKVVKGNKFKIRKKRMIVAAVSLAVIISVIIFFATSPTGPVERITNAIALMGSGEYPTSLSGTGVVSVKNENDKTFALTNSHLCGFNTSGKRFIEFQHNFSDPVLETASERVLLFNRESAGYMIANNTDVLFENNLPNSIYCADICNSGYTAFVTASASYAAQVTVFSKDMEQVFAWYLAEGLITDVTLSDDGERLAVSVLNANNEGRFISKIYGFNTENEKGTPIFEIDFEDEAALQLENVSDTCFLFRSNKKLVFVNWEDGNFISGNSNLPTPAFYTNYDEGVLAVYGETAHSKIINYDLEGNKLYQIEFNGLVDDISLYDETLYLLSGNQLHIYDKIGKEVKTMTLEQGPSFIMATDGGVLCVDNLKILFYEYAPIS